MKHYRQVSIEELPENDGFYSTDEGYEQFKNGSWFLHEDQKPTWWLKPIEAHVLTEEELKYEMIAYQDWISTNYFRYDLDYIDKKDLAQDRGIIGRLKSEKIYQLYQQHLKDKQDGK